MGGAFQTTRALRQRACFAGAWRSSSDSASIAVTCPATGEHIGDVPRLTREVAALAIEAAATAFTE